LKMTIEIKASRVNLKSTNETWSAISVESIGLPISPAEVKKLSERGFRGDAAKQRIPAGTGIGLYLARRVMDLHQGLLHASAQGNKASFSLLFPAKRIK
jgi:signal transduction histidine kinase